jgi:hypothetical protein
MTGTPKQFARDIKSAVDELRASIRECTSPLTILRRPMLPGQWVVGVIFAI